MSTDFIDDDLLRGARSRGVGEDDEVLVTPISDAGIHRMAKQKQELSSQMADAVKEIEQLKSRQGQLERERADLEDCARKQESYEQGKQDMVRKLNESLVLLEKEENQAVRMCELLSETRERFKKILVELSEIDEESWGDDNYQMELNRALVRVDIAETDYKKALAKIEAASWHKVAAKRTRSEPSEPGVPGAARPGFVSWLKAGLAISIPFAVILGIYLVIWMYMNGMLGK